jgi:hypothetical protein
MPKASAPLPPRLSRKRFSPVYPATERDAEVLLRFKHISQYRMSPTTFDAALAICQLQATLNDMCGADISDKLSKRRKFGVVSSTDLITSTITASSLPSSSSPSPSACNVEHLSLPRINPQRYRMIDPTYGSVRITATNKLSEESHGRPLPVMPEIPTIKISLKSLEKLRKSLHKMPAFYRVIDPDYGSKKRKRD